MTWFAPILVVLVLALPHAAHASSPPEPICVFLLPERGGEAVVNRCNACREVMLERERFGVGAPTVRALMLPGEAMTSLPFRGPGRTRILGERACPAPSGRHGAQAISAGGLGYAAL